MQKEFPLREFFQVGAIAGLGNGKLLVGYGKRGWLEKPRDGESFFYAPDFFLTQSSSYFSHQYEKEFSFSEFKALLSDSLLERPSVSWKPCRKSEFASVFNGLKEKMASKNLVKGVPFVFETSTYAVDEIFLRYVLTCLVCQAESTPGVIYGFWEKDQGMLGITPEILFCLNNERLTTVACGGTYSAGAHRFSEDEKTLHEHRIIIQGIEEALRPFADMVLKRTTLVSFQSISHLMTPIDAKLKCQITFDEIVKALHPTPALGAHPKNEGIEWLKEIEKTTPRFRFGAPFAYSSGKGSIRCLVAIRNVQWMQKKLFIGAGCGVVEASELEAEWKEIGWKINAIKGALGL